MATIKYLIRGKKEISTIYVRLKDGRNTDLTTSAGYTINPNYWSNKKGEVKEIAEFQNKVILANELTGLKRKIEDSLNNDKGKMEIDLPWLKLVIDKYKNPLLEQKTELLTELLRAYQEKLRFRPNKRTGKPTSPSTLRNFNTTIRRIEKFEAFKKRKLSLLDIDLSFHTEYMKFAGDKLGLAVNSYGKDLRQIKTVCLDARDEGYAINRQVETSKFNSPKEKTTFVTLSEIELDRIKEFEGSDYLNNARDWLIIGCWTGCRVNDLMKLSNENLHLNKDGIRFIRYTQSKTGNTVDIPIHNCVKDILNKLGSFPRPISDQKFNKYIKEVSKESGIVEVVTGSRQNPKTHRKEVGKFEKWQLIRSHTCRRSFATNHYNKLPNKRIMAVTGHKTEAQFLAYIGEVDSSHIEDFLTLWNDETKTDNRIRKMKA